MSGDQLENLNEKVNWHWRNSMRVVRFLAFDARAAAPLPLLLVYARLSTLLLTIATLLLFRYFEQKGLTTPAAMRSLRANLVGKFRPGQIGVLYRRFKDFG